MLVLMMLVLAFLAGVGLHAMFGAPAPRALDPLSRSIAPATGRTAMRPSVAVALTATPTSTARPTAVAIVTLTRQPVGGAASRVVSGPSPVIAAPPRILEFSARPGAGNSVLLAWRVAGARDVRLDGRSVPRAGTWPLRPTRATVVTLTATGASGSVSKRMRILPSVLRISAGSPALLPKIVQFTIARDGRTQRPVVRWQVLNAVAVRLQGQLIRVAGSRALQSTHGGSYRLSASNWYGSIDASLVVPAIVHTSRGIGIHFSPPTIRLFSLTRSPGGQSAVLAWRTYDAVRVLLNGQRVPSSGTLFLPLLVQGAQYTLIAGNADGDARGVVAVDLGTGSTPGTQTYQIALPFIKALAVYTDRGRLVVTWTVLGATSVSLNGVPVAGSGSRRLAAGLDRIRLVAGNDAGSIARVIPIAGHRFAPLPLPSPTATPKQQRHVAKGKPSRTPTPHITARATARPSATPTRAPSATRTPRPTAAPRPTATPRPTPTPRRTNTRRHRATPTPSATHAPSTRRAPTATRSATPTASATARPTPSHTATRAPTRTATPRPARTPTPRPTRTPTPRPSRTPRPTHTPTPTHTATRTPTSTATVTRIPSTPTSTPRPTSRPTATPVPTASRTATATVATPSATPSPTSEPPAVGLPSSTATLPPVPGGRPGSV